MNIQNIYCKLAPIAVSTLVSLSAPAPPAVAADGKKALAQVPGLAPPMVPVHVTTPSTVARRGTSGNSAAAGASTAHRAAMIDYSRLAAKSYPVNRLQRALYLKQQGHVDQALVEFLKCAQENPLQVQAFYEQALIFKQKGYNKLAQSSLQQALAVKPEFRDARVLLASLYLEDGDLSHATRELVRSLGLDVDKKTPSPNVRGNAPASTKASIVQTPHGSLPVPEAPQTVPAARPARNVGGLVTAHEGDAFSQGSPAAGGRDEHRSSVKPAPAGGDNQAPAGSFAVKELSTPQSADDELLKKILGISTPPPESQAPAANAGPYAVRKVVNQGKVSGQNDNPLPAGAQGAKVISAQSRDAQQLLSQIKTQGKSNSFAWFNPFRWFDKGPTATPKPEEPPVKPQAKLVKQVQQRARKMSEPQKPRVAGWFDGVRGHLHKSKAQNMSPSASPDITAMLKSADPDSAAEAQPAASPDFNPVRTMAETPSEPVHQPIFRRLVSWLPLPIFKPLFHRQLAPLPQPKLLALQAAPAPVPVAAPPQPAVPQLPAQSNQHAQRLPLMAPLVSELPQPVVPTPAVAPPSPLLQSGNPHNTMAIEQLLKLLPHRVIADIQQAFAPRPVDIRTDSGQRPPLQPVEIKHQSAAAAVPAPVAGLSRSVYDSLVNARLSPSSMPEAANPLVLRVVPQAPPILFTAVHSPARGGGVQCAQFDPAALIDQRSLNRVQETTLDAQMNKALAARGQPTSVVPNARAWKTPGRTFTAPALTAPRQYVVRGVEIPQSQLKMDPSSQDATVAVPTDDKWTARMRYLLAHGTNSLTPREAFIYSEETGQGQFFLADGTIVRRQLALKQTHQDVARLRRPDIYNAQGELRYNLSLLGKIIKPSETHKPKTASAVPESQDDSVNSLLGGSDGFLGWLKSVFRM